MKTLFLKKLNIYHIKYIFHEKMSPSNDLFLQVFLFQNKSHKYYDENITFSHITIFQYYIVFTICILNVFNRCPDLPVSYSPVYFSKSLQCFHQRLHNTSADIWYTTASKYSCHMVEQKAFYVVIFLHVFTYIW